MHDVETPATVSDLTWLVGRWQATIPGLPNDCSVEPQDLTSVLDFLVPWGGVLPGVWRLNQDALTVVSIREIDQTLEWTEQEITPTLEPRPGAVRLVYRLRSRAPNSVAFESDSAVGHAGVRAMRMEFSRIEPGMLMLRFYRLNREQAWVLAREALHDRISQPNNGLQGTPSCP